MTFPPVTFAAWRAQVEQELAGRPFDKALVRKTDEGLAVAPLYVERPAAPLPPPEPPPRPFRVCMRPHAGASPAELAAELAGGAEALWLDLADAPLAALAALAPDARARTFFVFDAYDDAPEAALARVAAACDGADAPAFALNRDPLGRRARGLAADAALPADLAALGATARLFESRFPGATTATVSTLPYHDAGADAADELAVALSTGALYLGALLDAGLSPARAAAHVALRISVGRDTFLELCKLRALRACWRKLAAAVGAPGAPRPLLHAVCSARTLAVRDPWVNLLRVTTQAFAAILGGADLVTPAAFDQASGPPSALGRRIARNTGLVLREESFLGQVHDPAGGSYYLESLTDALAREAWRRFQALEREGGVARALASGALAARLEAAWGERLKRIARRETPVLGVSEFANLDETLPRPVAEGAAASPGGASLPATGAAAAGGSLPATGAAAAGASLPSSGIAPTRASLPATGVAGATVTAGPAQSNGPTPAHQGGLPAHRDAEAFEALRTRAEAKASPPEALLVTLGPYAESRPRAGFAAGFFAAGGIRSRESTADEAAPLACLCGSDERYAAEAVDRARALKAAGCGRLLVAGRPGALEGPLREAGVDGFVFVGCDALATLSDLLEGLA